MALSAGEDRSAFLICPQSGNIDRDGNVVDVGQDIAALGMRSRVGVGRERGLVCLLAVFVIDDCTTHFATFSL